MLCHAPHELLNERTRTSHPNDYAGELAPLIEVIKAAVVHIEVITICRLAHEILFRCDLAVIGLHHDVEEFVSNRIRMAVKVSQHPTNSIFTCVRYVRSLNGHRGVIREIRERCLNIHCINLRKIAAYGCTQRIGIPRHR